VPGGRGNLPIRKRGFGVKGDGPRRGSPCPKGEVTPEKKGTKKEAASGFRKIKVD